MVTQFLFLLPAKGVVAVPGFGLWVLACELCGIGNAARTGLEEKLLLGRILVVGPAARWWFRIGESFGGKIESWPLVWLEGGRGSCRQWSRRVGSGPPS